MNFQLSTGEILKSAKFQIKEPDFDKETLILFNVVKEQDLWIQQLQTPVEMSIGSSFINKRELNFLNLDDGPIDPEEIIEFPKLKEEENGAESDSD